MLVPGVDIHAVILAAKLGRERKDAQRDTCSVFAAALYDVLSGAGHPCQMVTVQRKGTQPWAHSVVAVAGVYFDSLGEFTTPIYRARAKIHHGVSLSITYEDDVRTDCYESEFDELHRFFVRALTRAMENHIGESV